MRITIGLSDRIGWDKEEENKPALNRSRDEIESLLESAREKKPSSEKRKQLEQDTGKEAYIYVGFKALWA